MSQPDNPFAPPETMPGLTDTGATATATNVRWLIVAMLMGFTILGHFNRVSISVAANEKFIGPGLLTAEQMGQVYSAFLLIYTLCMLPGGWVIDRIGPRLAMTGMAWAFALC